MDSRLFFPATARNREPILAVLREVLPAAGTVLEVACGSGEHAVYFAKHLAALEWQPTDADPAHLASVDAWARHEGVANMRPALRLDLGVDTWPAGPVEAVYCANLAHIAPWSVTTALLAGAAVALPPGAPLVLYGPFRVAGEPFAESNAAFDASLRARDPLWGVRALGDIVDAAGGFTLADRIAMPANNQVLVLRRR